MKKSIIVLLFIIFAGLQQMSARFSVGKAEHIKVVHDFPDTDDYKDEDGNYMDLGILYETYDIAGMPFWVSEEPVIVGLLNKNTNYYLDIEPDVAEEVLAAHDLNKEELLQLSFWDKYLGIVVTIIGIALLMLYNFFFGNHGDEEDENEGEVENVTEQNAVIIDNDKK